MNIRATNNSVSGYQYQCATCKQWVNGPHYCQGVPGYTGMPYYQYSQSILVDDETKTLLRRLVQLLEKLLNEK